MIKSRNPFAHNTKHVKNSTKNGFASASSRCAPPHSFENAKALSFISFQLKVIYCRIRWDDLMRFRHILRNTNDKIRSSQVFFV